MQGEAGPLEPKGPYCVLTKMVSSVRCLLFNRGTVLQVRVVTQWRALAWHV